MERRTMRGPTGRSFQTICSTDALYEVLSLFLEHVGIKSLARFGACSKRSRELSKNICQQHTRQLLPPLVKLASLKGLDASSTDDKVIAAIDWVVACAGAAALAVIADTLLAIPRVPRSIAFKLINCGVSVSWEQLKAAAESRTAGIEGWAAGPLMPFMVVAVCSIWGDHRFMHDQLTADESWLCTPASDIPDLLRLAVNSQKPEAAQGLLQLMQDDPAHQMQQLRMFHHQNEQQYQYMTSQQLQAYQQRGCSVPQILQQQEMQQAWHAVQQQHQQEQQQLRDRPQQLQQLLTTDLVVELLHTAALRGHWAVIGQLFDFDAAQLITADVAAELLHAAVQRRSVVGLGVIIKHEAAKQLSADALCSLMQSALQTAFQGAWPKLLQLPAAAAVTTTLVFQLLKQAVAMRDAVAAHHMCRLSAASTLSTEDIVSLILQASTQMVSRAVEDLTALPGALLISTDSMVLLLQTAMQQADIVAVKELMKTDTVNQLDTQQLGQLCKMAIEVCCVNIYSIYLELLLELPAADDLDESQVEDLIRAALQQSKRDPCRRSSFNILHAVVQLPAAQKLPPSLICECFEQLVYEPGTDDLIDMFCDLEYAHMIDDGSEQLSSQLGNVILAALLLKRFAAAESLSWLTCFIDLRTDILVDLLSTAMEMKQEDLAIRLCDGGVAQKLPSSALVRMLHVATRLRLCTVVRCLLELNAASDMHADVLSGLMKEQLKAVDSCTHHTSDCILIQYLAHAAAAHLHWSQLADLMCFAIQQNKDYAVAQFCKLPGAQDSGAVRLVDLVLHVALQREDAYLQPLPPDSFIAAICQLPAAQQINAARLRLLMEPVVRAGRTQLILQLYQLPAAADLDAAAVVQLGTLAMHCGNEGIAALLSSLPGATLVTRQDLLFWLKTAIATGNVDIFALLGCQPIGQCHTDRVLTIFGFSKLRAAEKLLTEDVAALMKMCLQEQDQFLAAEQLQALSKLPAAEHLSPDQLSSLLQTAVQLGLDCELQSLCELHQKVQGPFSDGLICQLLDVADTCTPKCSAEVLGVLSKLQKEQRLPGFVCGLH